VEVLAARVGSRLQDIATLQLNGDRERWAKVVLERVLSQAALRTNATEWMVLVNPSLQLMERGGDELAQIAGDRRTALKQYSLDLALCPDSSLTAKIQCAEMHSPHPCPDAVRKGINQALRSCACDGDGEKSLSMILDLVNEKRDVPTLSAVLDAAVESEPNLSELREAWAVAVGVYTNWLRVVQWSLPVYGQSQSVLGKRALAVVKTARKAWEKKQFERHVSRLVPPMLSYALKDRHPDEFAYYLYKISAMATHTLSTLVPVFSGAFGMVNLSLAQDDEPALEITTWRTLHTAFIQADMNFTLLVRGLLQYNPDPRSFWKELKKVSISRSRWLRVLDFLCYASTALVLCGRGMDVPRGELEILQVRRKGLRGTVRRLFRRDVFPDPGTRKGCLVRREFLTFAKTKASRQRNELHLVAGLFMLFWNVSLSLPTEKGSDEEREIAADAAWLQTSFPWQPPGWRPAEPQ